MSDDAVKIPPALDGVGGWLDDRFHGAKGVRTLFRIVAAVLGAGIDVRP